MSPELLEIDDRDDRGFMRIGLQDFIETLERIGPNLTWYLREVSAIGRAGSGIDVDQLLAASRTPPLGKRLSWEELKAIAGKLLQVEDGMIAGCASSADVPAIGNDDLLHGRCDVVLEAVDSTRWVVSTTNPQVRAAWQERFTSMRLVPSE